MKVRWNSTYLMLKKVKGYENVFTTFINAQGIKEKNLKYFDAIPHLYCFALIFDPCKKLEQLNAAFHFIGNALDLGYSHVRNEIFRVFSMYQKKYGQAPQRTHPV
ncbi:hypothetical protein PR202_gb12642 [Eleusine coracana subsp. coracana]|uniref:Uncharacterized protein n=1 Tax=Eleusine coracana subsp. coracana TaxID=191504 RepID=A0AAV5ES04_ELECO|nr:hypothetical protein PR202_gb12642 [Eleusine coracana subsp. coracana]